MSSSMFGSFGSSGAPGFVPPSATAALGPAMGVSEQAMANRYSQLGLGGPGTTGGAGPEGTAEKMDLGQLPSLTGGIPGQFAAVAGELQNAALAQNPGGSGKSGSPLSAIGGIGSILGGK